MSTKLFATALVLSGSALFLSAPASAQLTFGTQIEGATTTETVTEITGTFRQLGRQNVVEAQPCGDNCNPQVPYLNRTTNGFDLTGNAFFNQSTLSTQAGVSFVSGTLPGCTARCWPATATGAAPLNLLPPALPQAMPNYFGLGSGFQGILLSR